MTRCISSTLALAREKVPSYGCRVVSDNGNTNDELLSSFFGLFLFVFVFSAVGGAVYGTFLLENLRARLSLPLRISSMTRRS